MDLEAFLRLHDADLDLVVEGARTIAPLERGDSLIAVGSLAEGLGNRKSDVDLLLVTPRPQYAQASPDEVLSFVAGRCIVDMRIVPAALASALQSRLRTWTQSGWNLTVAADFTASELLLLHRLSAGRQLSPAPEAAQNDKDATLGEDVARLKLHVARHMARTLQVDMAGYREVGDSQSLVYSAQDLLGHAVALNRYSAEIGKPDGQRLEEFTDAHFPALRQQIVSPAPIHGDLEKTVLTWWLTKVREYLGTSDPDVRALLGNNSPEEIADMLVTGMKLAGAPLRAQLLEGGASAINAYHDPLMDFARTLDAPARAVRADSENSVEAVITKNAALIAKARFALEGKGTYPDATFTLRLSYGAVAGYEENGRTVTPTTNFAGAYAHATGRDPFKLPDSWIRAQKTVDPNAQLNFTSTNDIIGGNSGSPVIGRNGEAIGLIFDGNIQSLGGDFGYDGSQNRAIAVDVTGITEALKSIYHADRLVKELTH